ncbi:MAG: molybdenum cofactor biosynthesis protein MoaE [Bacteroidota bacterium]
MAPDLPLIHLTDQALDVQIALDQVRSDNCGAVNLFVGTVRDHTGDRPVVKLDFEAYEKMALTEMKKIAVEAQIRWPIAKLVIHHRTGELRIGEIAVIIAVATPHRKASFEAVEYVIDTLKQTVPIWKKEFFEDGSHWVAAHP